MTHPSDSESFADQPRTPNERITMGILAQRLGVTKTTVSLALRGHKNISQKTRDRVVKLADELNYRPDPAIAAVASKRWSVNSPQRHRVIAFLAHHTSRSFPGDCFYLSGSKKRATELGYKLEPFYVDEYPSAKSVTRVLHSRGIRGIVVPPIHNPDSKRAMYLDWNKFTAVCCGVGRVRPPLHTVTSDVFVTTRLAWEITAKAGYRRPGAALHCHTPIADDDWQRIGASQAALRFLDLDQVKIPIHTGDICDESALLKWYDETRPDIVVGFNNTIGDILERNGVRIPEDTAFLSLNTFAGTKWSGIVHHSEQIARTALDILHNELRDNRWGLPAIPHITLIQPEWNPGSSFEYDPKLPLSQPHVLDKAELTS